MFEGSIVAIVTPFSNGNIDKNALEELVEFHIDNGTHGIVVCGTTGESPTLSHEEHEYVIEIVVKAVNKRIPVIAGTGSNSTNEAVSLTRFAKKIGADGSLLVVPYYNKPTQEGMYEHFGKIATEVDIPIILYNVPGRTGTSISPATTARLAKNFNNIVGIKDATGSIQNSSRILSLTGRDFILLSGEDSINFPVLAVGGKGFITVTANILPREVADLYNNFKNGNLEVALNIHYNLLDINDILFVEANPIPVKTALSLMGKISDEIRLPLTNISDENLILLKKTLDKYQLI